MRERERGHWRRDSRKLWAVCHVQLLADLRHVHSQPRTHALFYFLSNASNLPPGQVTLSNMCLCLRKWHCAPHNHHLLRQMFVDCLNIATVVWLHLWWLSFDLLYNLVNRWSHLCLLCILFHSYSSRPYVISRGPWTISPITHLTLLMSVPPSCFIFSYLIQLISIFSWPWQVCGKSHTQAHPLSE